MNRPIARHVIAFVFAPLVPVLVYVWVSFGAEAFFPFIFIALAVAYGLTIVVAVPAYLVLLAKGKRKLRHMAAVSAAAFFVAFLIINLFSYASYETLQVGGGELVVSGEITLSGYLKAGLNSAVVALLAGIGGVIFWLIAIKD